MDPSHLSPRFRVLEWLHRPHDDVALAAVRDAVTGAEMWALWVAGRRDAGLAVAMHHRALDLAPLPLVGVLRNFRVVETEEGTAALFDAFEGESWTAHHSASNERARASMIRGLENALQQERTSSRVLGRVRADALWWTPEGVRLLPSAWLLPVEPPLAHTHTDARDPRVVAREIAELWTVIPGREDSDPPAGEVRPDPPADLVAALESVRETSAWLAVHAAEPPRVAQQVETWARSRSFHCARVGEFGSLRAARREGAAPTIVVLDDVSRYAGVADALSELQRAGWIDGHETLVVIARTPVGDEALELYAAKRFGRGSRRDLTLLDAQNERAIKTKRVPLLDPTAGRVLEFIVASDRAVTAHTLARATGIEAEQLARVLLELCDREWIDAGFAHHAEASGVQLVVRLAANVSQAEIDPHATRIEELRVLLANTLKARPRPSLSMQWLRAEAARVRGGADADRRWRELALRAQGKGQDLLAFAAWNQLFERREGDGPLSREDQVRAAICRSEQYQAAGDIDRGADALLHALDSAESATDADPGLEAELVLSMAKLEIHRSDYAAAEQRLSTLLARSKDLLGVEPRGRAYVELGWVQLFLGRTRESVRTHELALRILDPLHHADLIARVHNSIGFALYKESDYTGSIVHYERAIRLREQLGDELGVARAYNNLALSQRALGQLPDAERSLVESLRRKRAGGDELSYAASLLNLGFVQLDLADPDAAEQSVLRCLEIATARRHPETEAEAWGLRGEIALARGELDRALEFLQRDLEICEATEHQSERLATLRRLAEVLLRLQRDDAAASHLVSARELLLHQPSRYETALLDGLDAALQLRAGRAEAAVERFGAAARGLGLVGRPQAQVEALARRGLAEAQLGRSERARATLAEVKELVGRHELHDVPEAVNVLERTLHGAPVEAGPLAADECLDVLVEALAAPGEGPEGAAHVASSVMTALACEAALWIAPDGAGTQPSGDHWEPATVPSELRSLESGATAEIQRRGDWTAVSLATAGGWLALQRVTPLRPAEEQLLRGLVRAWTRSLPHESEAGGNGAAAEGRLTSVPAATQGLVGRSDALREILHMIKRVAATDVGVLILGENGTGKELVAQAIHRESARRRGRFIAVNCASIPGTLLESELFGHERGAFTSAHARRLGRFELAHGGTLMLDEIGEMPLEMQAKILRVLQERSFTRLGGGDVVRSDARIVAATNRDLEREVERGRFRMDLYFRLNVVTIRVPSLRERPEDIEPLTQHFLRRHGPEYGAQIREVSPDAMRALVAYSWPGNVRELENALKHALVFAAGGVLRAEDLPASVHGSGAGPRNRDLEQAAQSVLETEDFSEERPLLPRLELLLAREMVRRVGNKTVAARLLGVTKPTLYSRLRRYEALYGEESES